RAALPALLREGLTVPEHTVAVGAVFWHRFGQRTAEAPQFVAYLPEGRIVGAHLYPDGVADARSWAEAMVLIAADVDPEAVAGLEQARVAVYAPLGGGGGAGWVDIWLGDSPTPWRAPGTAGAAALAS
ncbi:MAG: hypothetical protein Q4F67_06045, partial [Propionibacteriaceae bacterium]|nr:hypothetical protein [Propionibacteriaceae bacterium]